MTKIWGGAKSESERERENLKNFWKGVFEKVKFRFLKNLIHNIRLIEKQFRSIEPDRGSLKFLKEISIDRKTDWINRKFGKTFFLGKKKTWFLKTHLKALKIRNKMHEYKMKCFSKTLVLNPSFPKIKIFNYSPFKNSNTKYVLHKQYSK